MRLLHIVGNVENLYAAFFHGAVEKISDPIAVALLGSPVNPFSTSELAGVIERLKDADPVEVEALRINVFMHFSTRRTRREVAVLLAGAGEFYLRLPCTDGVTPSLFKRMWPSLKRLMRAS